MLLEHFQKGKKIYIFSVPTPEMLLVLKASQGFFASPCPWGHLSSLLIAP